MISQFEESFINKLNMKRRIRNEYRGIEKKR
jgi:hypothetical protein